MKKTSKTAKKASSTIKMSAEAVRLLPKLTPRELAAIAKGPIDTSDIPEITQRDLASGAVRVVRRLTPKTTLRNGTTG